MTSAQSSKQIKAFVKKAMKKERLEKSIQKDIVTWLTENVPGEKLINKIHGSPFQRAGMPDICMYWNGTSWHFEVKKPGEEPTEIQKKTIIKLRRSGNHAWVVRSVEEVTNVMTQHIDHRMNGRCHWCEGLNGNLEVA